MSDNIHVAVRMRPLITREKESKATIHWKAEGSTIYQTNMPSVQFNFDRVFNGIDTNEILYEEFCAPLVKSVIDGFNGTIFAYGQTSSGKTHTMMGNDDGNDLGIIHYTISDIFNHIQDMPDREFLLRVSYMEIYNEMVVDLLTQKNENLKLKEDKYGHIKVNGLTEHIVQEADQVLALMRKGQKKRRVGETLMNERSSRSHSIFQVIIESGVRGDEDAAVNVSHFNLVDLAGSERARQTGAKGARLKESININKSLLMLSQVISQLSERVLVDQYINYRDSKLTRILQNSLGGNARTAIICTVTPASLDETISTLKFATRAKCIKNKPQVNEVLTEQALLKRYANEIKQLTKELETTKEEKAQQNKHLLEQILALRNKFVSQMAPNCTKKSTRRETWGGCLDAARLRLSFAPRKLLSELDVDTGNAKQGRSCTSSGQLSAFNEEPSRLTGSIWNTPLRDLATVDEENEFEFDAFDAESNLHSRFSKCSSARPSCVSSLSDAAVQTDAPQTPIRFPFPAHLQSSASHTATPKTEKIKELYSFIKTLDKELAESREFTKLEKQMTRAQNLGLDDGISEKAVGGQTREALLTENGTPKRSDSRFSIGDESTLFKNESCLLENHSSTPLQSSSDAVNSNVSSSEDCKIDKFRLEVIQESNLPVDKLGLDQEKFADEKVELFQYLGDTIKLLSNRTEMNSVSKTGKLSEQYGVLLQMFNMVLYYQCSKLDTNLVGDLTGKMAEISESLNEILWYFSDESVSSEDIEDRIDDFMYKTNLLLKEIEMLSLDMDCGKSSVKNAMPIENSNEMHSFEVSSVINTTAKTPEISCIKSYVDNAINTTIDYPPSKSPELLLFKSCVDNAVHTSVDYPQTAGDNLDEHDIDFKTQVASLQKDVETHLKTISELREDINLNNEQVASLEDEMRLQSEIIDCLKEELAVKGNNTTADKASENVCHTGLDLTDGSCQTSYLEERKETNETKASENVCQSGLEFMDDFCQTSFLEECEEINRTKAIENVYQHGFEFADGSCQTSFLGECEEKNKTKESLSLANSNFCDLPETAGVHLPSEFDETLLQAKISTLEKKLESNEKVISDLKYSIDLKDKQVTLFKDKVQIQELMIEGLREELSLNNTGNLSKELPEGICSCGKVPSSFIDNSTQTFFMDKLSLYNSYPEDVNDQCELKSVPQKCTATKSLREPSAHSSMTSSVRDSDSMDHYNPNTILNVTLEDMKELEQFMSEFMERNVERKYLGEASLPQENKDSSVQDKIKTEVNALKEMLCRLELYLKNKSESNEFFQNVLENKAEELLSLRRKFSDTESKLQRMEVEDKDLDETLSDLINIVSVFVEKYEAPKHLEWSVPVAYKSKALKRVLTLQKVNQILDYFIQEKNSLQATNLPKTFAIKLTKSVQTAEDPRHSKVSEELSKFKAENTDLLNDISNLKLRIEKANSAKEEIECRYKEKETSHRREIENLKAKYESEKCSLTLKCVQTVEEKCDQMLIDQENKFYSEIDGINEQHRRQMQEKADYHKAEMAKVDSEYKHEIVVLKNEYLKDIAAIQDKLSKVIEERYSERIKLESDINSLKREVSSRTELCSKFKQKCKQYVAEMQRLAAKSRRSTRDFAVQTSVLPSLEQTNKKEEKIFINKGTQLRTIKFQRQLLECDFCVECMLILKSRSQEPESNPNLAEDNICCKRLQNELETKKAKIITLTRNNETLVKETVALNKELSAKMVLLRSCQCRGIGNGGQMKLESSDKRKEFHHSTDKNGEAASSVKRKEIVFSSEADVLKSDLVQRALATAIEEDRVKLCDNGPASVMANCLLKRELNLKDKENRNMRKELAELKTYGAKRHAIQGNEKQPVKGPDFEEKELTSYTQAKHPYPLGMVPKLQTKQILKERNKAPQLVNNPLKAKAENKDAVCENPAYLNPLSTDLPQAATDAEREKKLLVEKTKRELGLYDGGEPECKQQ